MLHLGDRVVDIGDRDHPHADQPVGRDRAIFLAEPVVVAADHRLVDLVMRDVAPEHGARDHRREQHLGVHAVLVLLPDALLGAAGAGGVGDLEAEGLPGARGAAGAQIEEIGLQQRLALDHQRVAAIGQMHRVRRAVAVFLRDPVRSSARAAPRDARPPTSAYSWASTFRPANCLAMLAQSPAALNRHPGEGRDPLVGGMSGGTVGPGLRRGDEVIVRPRAARGRRGRGNSRGIRRTRCISPG